MEKLDFIVMEEQDLRLLFSLAIKIIVNLERRIGKDPLNNLRKIVENLWDKYFSFKVIKERNKEVTIEELRDLKKQISKVLHKITKKDVEIIGR